MKRRLSAFIAELRQLGIRISTAEAIDAANAVAAIGLDQIAFRESLSATLVKDEADRPRFDAAFDSFFFPTRASRHARRTAPASGSGAGGRGQPESGAGRSLEPPPQPAQRAPSPEARREKPGGRSPAGERLHRERELLDRPFAEMSPDELDDCVALAERLAERFRARRRRRTQRSTYGRLDLRRTIRRSIGAGGVPLELRFRRRRPGKPDLTALCDVSHSVAGATRFLLSLLGPAPDSFRSCRLFGFVDATAPITLESRRLVPLEPIDFYARSDYGKMLQGFWQRYATAVSRNTIVLVLGDARNNRRPPRLDLLKRIQRRARQVVWMNPEAPGRWNTGDSVVAIYRAGTDLELAASTPKQLLAALDKMLP